MVRDVAQKYLDMANGGQVFVFLAIYHPLLSNKMRESKFIQENNNISMPKKTILSFSIGSEEDLS